MRMVGSSFTQFRDSGWGDRIEGTSGRDMIEITWGDDTVQGGGGDDVIWDLDGSWQGRSFGVSGEYIDGASNDTISGGAGNDTIFAGLGADTISGGSGTDTVDYGYSSKAVHIDLAAGRGYGAIDSDSYGDELSSIEIVHGSDYNDRLIAKAGGVDLYGEDGNDTLVSADGARLFGGAGNDQFVIRNANVYVGGGDGVDTLDFSEFAGPISRGERSLSADAVSFGLEFGQIENVIGSAYGDGIRVFGNASDVRIANGRAGDDLLQGADSQDYLFGEDGDDVLNGGNGDDVIDGGSDDDRLNGDAGDDVLWGGTGHDTLQGGSGNDTMTGGSGNDTLSGGTGNDKLTGGTGADRFVFDTFAPTSFGGVRQVDVIRDFQQGSDLIDLSAIDASREISGDQAFKLGSGFTALRLSEIKFDLANSLRPSEFSAEMLKFTGHVDTRIAGDETLVSVHFDNDGLADLTVVLTGQFNLNGSDFIL